MTLERLAYLLLAIAAVGWTVLALAEVELSDLATSEGAMTILTIAGLALLLVKAIGDRRSNPEDDHYSRTVER